MLTSSPHWGGQVCKKNAEIMLVIDFVQQIYEAYIYFFFVLDIEHKVAKYNMQLFFKFHFNFKEN